MSTNNEKPRSRAVETPLMKQYYKMKEKHPDAILLFRVGDFYETFVEDAIETARILGITLTKRANGVAQHVELAGFPHHALDTYLPRLVRAGKRVAICDQLEDPKLTKKLVKRGITELVTPGVAITDNMLENKSNNFLAALHYGARDLFGIAFIDISTGQFYTTEGDAAFVRKMLASYSPKEVIVLRNKKDELKQTFASNAFVYPADDWFFNESNNRNRLLRHFKTQNLKGFGLEESPLAVAAAGAILNYMDLTQHGNLGHVTGIKAINESTFVRLDNFTIYSLELLQPMHKGGNSLFTILDKTASPMGARLLQRWIMMPLKEVKEIEQRLQMVTAFTKESALIDALQNKRNGLAAMGDLERTVSRVAMRRATPQQLVSVCNALKAIENIKKIIGNCNNEALKGLANQLDSCEPLTERLQYELDPDAPAIIGKGRIIASGYNAELDELRSLAHNGSQYLIDMQTKEAERTGISSLKIGFNNVFGYYLEVRNTHKKQVPPEWIRKQTLVNAERYITEELKAYESKILGAQERIASLELQLFNELLDYCQNYIAPLHNNCHILAQLDVLASFASVAKEYNYVCPEINDSLKIDITEGRHPVIEYQMGIDDYYIPNSVLLNNDAEQVMIITGPNMSGKSALLRQTALITLMAQIGSFVPAEKASIGIVDAIFTRVGASDNISMGESTFMVEMQEAANILNNLTNRSLILFDEIGRGTGTFDGLSIAWAIVEYLHNHPSMHPKTLFATHYHELNELASVLPRVRNFNVSAHEVNGDMVFLRKLEPGGNEQSFGIQVAKIAGMPAPVLHRAKDILEKLEESKLKEGLALDGGKAIAKGDQPNSKRKSSQKGEMQVTLFDISDPALLAIRDELQETDINQMTPLEALNKLNQLKVILNKY